MRRLGVLPAAVILATLTWVAGAGPTVPLCAAADGNRAALVVEHGDGSVVQRCVAFDGASIGGVDLLDASGLRWSGQPFSGLGRAVCAIDGEPATYSSCPGGDRYWALFLRRAGGSWQLSAVGISSLALADGDAIGFRYALSSGIAAPPPAPEPCPVAATALPTAPGGAPTNSAPATVPAASLAGPSTAPPAAAASAAASGGPAVTTSSSAAPSVGGPSPTASSPPGSPNPSESGTAGSGGGLDPGLLATVVGIGVLGCFALVRLAARQRTTR